MTVREAAALLGCSEQWVRLMLARGRLAGVRHGATVNRSAWEVHPGQDGRLEVRPASRGRGRPRKETRGTPSDGA